MVMQDISAELERVIQELLDKMKKRKLPRNLREMFLESLYTFPKTFTIKANKLLLNKEFYIHHINTHNLDNKGSKADKEQFKFFMSLINRGLIHKRSPQYKNKLSLISINPNPHFIYQVNLSDVENLINVKEDLYNTIDTKFFNSYRQLVYNDLRLFVDIPLSAKEIASIDICNNIYINENTALLYFEYPAIMHQTLPSYYLVIVNRYEIVSFFTMCKTLEKNRPFRDSKLEKNFKAFKEKYFSKQSIAYIKMLNQNSLLYESTPFHAIMKTTRNIFSSITLAEIDYMYPGKVPDHLSVQEKERINHSLQRPEVDIEDDEPQQSFTMKDFIHLEELLKIKPTEKQVFLKKASVVVAELEKYIHDKNSTVHGKFISKFILHLLLRTTSKSGIRISTFKGYIGLLNKHIFSKIKDISNLQNHELESIFYNLQRLRYKEKSIKKIYALTKSFFYFCSQKIDINILTDASYPKSMVFADELDKILNKIEEKERNKNIRCGARIEFSILQKQALAVLAFYTGLRKGELRSRLLSDIYLDNGKICIDVNKVGTKKCKLDLKTDNAIRRVCECIPIKHLKVLKEFWRTRRLQKKRYPTVFLKVANDYSIKSKPVSDSIFHELSEIIQEVTGRYTSFHSLRHSYVTYQTRKLLQCKNCNIYGLLDLSIKAGHQTPEISMRIYAHASLLLLNVKQKNLYKR
jgi:integrase